jgi:hypothetical protein
MDTVELRLMFVVGLVALGGAALVIGAVLSRLTEFVRSRRDVAARSFAGRMQTSLVRHRAATGSAYRERGR